MKSANWIRRTVRILALTAAILILCLLLAAVVFMTALDDDDYQRLAEWSVKQFTGCQMIVEGPFTVAWSAEPALSAAGIRFESIADGPQPSLTAIGQFHVKVALKPLLLGRIVIKQLRVEEVLLSIDSRGAGEDAGPQRRKSPPDIIIPIFESVVLQNIQVNVVDPDGERKVNVLLRQLTLDDVKDTGPLFAKAEGAVNANDFHIEGRLGALADIFKKKQPYPVELELKIVDFRMTVSGTVDHPLEGEGLNLQLAAEEQELSNLLNILQLDVPAVGRLKFAATLSGDAAAPRISGLNLDITDGTSVKLSARGSIANMFSGTETYISIDEGCTNKDLLKLIFPDNWKVVNEFRFTGTLGNIEGDYTLEDIEASVANDKDITLKAAGWLRFGDFIDGNILKAVDVNLSLASPRTDALRPLLTDEIPEIGSVTAEGRLTGPVERLALEDLLIRRGGTGPVQMISRGRIGRIPLEDGQPIAEIDLDVSIQSEQSTILSTFYGVLIDEIGSVSLTGRVTGSTDRFQISDLQLRTADAHGLKTALSGGIAFAEQPTGEILGNLNCKLRIDAPDMKAAEPLIMATLFPGLGPISAEAVVTGTTDVLVIDDIAVMAGRPERVQIKWNGRIGQFPLTDDRPFSDFQTVASLQAADASALAELFGLSLPDIGPLQGSWRATDRNEIIGFEDVKIGVGDGEKFQLKAAGAIDSVFRHDELSLDGIDLQIRIQAADTHLISKLLEIPLPDLGTVDGRLTLSGGQEALAIRDIDLTSLSPKGLEIKTTGAVGHIGLAKETTIKDVDVQLTARAPDVSAVPLFTDRGLPELGLFQLSVQLKDRADSLDVERFDIRTGTAEKATLRINGRIHHLQSRKHEAINLQADFEALSQPWLQTYFKRSPAESPQFSGSMRLALADGPVRIDGFKIGTAELGGLSVQASGTVNVSAQKPEIDVNIISSAGNPSAWGPVWGVSFPRAGPLTVNGRYSLHADKHIFQGETRIGSTPFQTNFRGAFDRQRPGMDLVISAATVNLEDLGLYPEAQTAETVPLPPPPIKKVGPLFDEKPLPFDALQAFDFSLRLIADTVLGKNVAINEVGLDVILENGRLRIGPSTLNYRQGFMSIEAGLDASSDAVPEMEVKIAAEDLDIDDVLSYLHKPLIFEGQLNLVVDLRSTGRSIKQIASGLTGELGVALENGRIQRIINLLAADALDFLFTAPVKNTYTDLNCMVARLQFEDGNGAIQVLYMDTPAVRARGAGSVNLADETLDLVINPEAKRRLFKRSSPVRIQGQLGDPSIKKVPATEAVGLAAQIFVPFVALPARALGYLWSLIRNDKDEKSPCINNSLPDKLQESIEK
jgi:uncharacterized protein involved in outer membrane biogenesis